MMVWLAPGLSQGDAYKCKSCHLTFLVGAIPPVASEDAAPSQFEAPNVVSESGADLPYSRLQNY